MGDYVGAEQGCLKEIRFDKVYLSDPPKEKKIRIHKQAIKSDNKSPDYAAAMSTVSACAAKARRRIPAFVPVASIMTVNCKQIIGTYTLFCGRIKTIIRKLEDRMSRRRQGHGCGITVLVLLFIFILAGSGLGVFLPRNTCPAMSWRIRAGYLVLRAARWPLFWITRCRRRRESTRMARYTCLWTG